MSVAAIRFAVPMPLADTFAFNEDHGEELAVARLNLERTVLADGREQASTGDKLLPIDHQQTIGRAARSFLRGNHRRPSE